MRLPFLLYLMLVVASANVTAWAGDAAPKCVKIPSKDLGHALTDFGDQTGLVVIVGPGVDVRKLVSAALEGCFAPIEGLNALLGTTGLRVERESEGTYMVVEKGEKSPQSRSRSKPPGDSGETVVITGTHIHGVELSSSPLMSFSLADINGSSAITTDQFMQRLLQNFRLVSPETSTAAGINSQAGSNLARGTGIDLYGLGTSANLVLVDGMRVAPSGIDGSYFDFSMLPLVAMERIDVLTDGASAIYGSDAIAGVVNFVLRRDFEGVQVTPLYSYSTDGGGGERGVSLLTGHIWPTGGGMLAYEKYQEQAVDASSREFLTPEPVPYQVIPPQARNSVVAALHQIVMTGVELSMNGYYSRRDFSQLYLSVPATSTLSQGGTRIGGGIFTAKFGLPAQWETELTGNYSDESETVVTSAMNSAELIRTNSRLGSVDGRASGPVFSWTAGQIRVSSGASVRWEKFDDRTTDNPLKRKVFGIDEEAFVPIVGDGNQLPWAKRVELSLALRWDDYRAGEAGFPNPVSLNPKIGLLWGPLTDLILRATFGTSFRMAPLAQLDELGDKAVLVPGATQVGSGMAYNTLYQTGGNSALRPEHAKTFTTGFDWQPDFLPGLAFSTTLFHIRYTDKVSTPPVVGSTSLEFPQSDAPFFNTAPSPAQVDAIYAPGSVSNPAHLGRGSVQAIFDGRLHNIAATTVSGIDSSLRVEVPTGAGDLALRLEGQYLTQLDNEAAPGSPQESAVNTVFNPPKLRAQVGAAFSHRRWSVSTTGDYTDPYKDTLVANSPTVASWFVIDGVLSYDTGELSSSILKGSKVMLSVRNLANRRPPHVQGASDETPGYDATNASPLGRVISLRAEIQLF